MKKAFTLLELVIVIIVIGILAAAILPRVKSNPLQEAALQVVSHIRYTQHLAIVDDKYDPNRKDTSGSLIWFKDRWQIVFSHSKFSANAWAYTIFADTTGNKPSRGDADEAEIARNPLNSGQIMTGGYGSKPALYYGDANFKGMNQLNLGKTYGVTSITFGNNCNTSQRIAFDHLGRPLKTDVSSMHDPYNTTGTQRLLRGVCTITLSDGTDSEVIKIEPETGYAHWD